jgi:multicomponent Na+:H+ antiporter subunit D
MVAGVYLAIGQWDLKRLFAYHSISQMGYVFLGVGLATPIGILGGLFHLINHATFKSLLFLNSGAVEYNTGTRQLKEMGGLASAMPQTSATCTIASLSIAGIPPFNGFWSKLFIIIAAVASGHYFLAAIAVLVSIMTIASFMKVQKYAFFGTLPEHLGKIKEVPFLMVMAMGILALTCIVAGLFFPLVIQWLITPAVLTILNGTNYGIVALGGMF